MTAACTISNMPIVAQENCRRGGGFAPVPAPPASPPPAETFHMHTVPARGRKVWAERHGRGRTNGWWWRRPRLGRNTMHTTHVDRNRFGTLARQASNAGRAALATKRVTRRERQREREESVETTRKNTVGCLFPKRWQAFTRRENKGKNNGQTEVLYIFCGGAGGGGNGCDKRCGWGTAEVALRCHLCPMIPRHEMIEPLAAASRKPHRPRPPPTKGRARAGSSRSTAPPRT